VFPESPSPEWFVIDLLRHHDMAGASLSELLQNLVIALREGRFDASRLRAMAVEYGTKAIVELVDGCT
jgi:hypothetical protein